MWLSVVNFVVKHRGQFAIVAFLFLILSNAFLIRRLGEVKQDYNRSINNIKIMSDSTITRYKNDLGQEVARREVAELTNKEFSKALPKLTEEMRKHFKDLSKNLKQVESYTKQQLALGTQVTTEIVRDTVRINDTTEVVGFSFDYLEKHSRRWGFVDVENKKIQINTLDSINVHTTIRWDRKWFLGKKTYYIDTTSDNDNVKINSVEHFVIRKKRKKR